ncbi:tRNA-2-methylthio-N(6)-dimethylallyladenosine synthase [Candidatus Providencia siddallii]|uniref:tRNA-2-methylthio-N(6)-dimethylallyladenosine synthase n=1 Tax=Candidatus Providencia siddallii TaxID=1715285 RepID=A0A0M6W7U4_9GAMM|nr:tRNA-2-methylthio-N(6)-dimethylallyladenosine synthase [Candidatus Providencia siddallii]
MSTKKLYIKTFGCQMNQYDSSKIYSMLKNTHGYKLTENEEEADILILNTCSIRKKPQEKVFHQLGRWKKIKKIKQDIIICIGGCVASQEGDFIHQRAPYVNIIFGPQTLHRLPKMIDEIKKKDNFIIDISFPELEKFNSFPKPEAKGPTASISIIEGCNKYCTFCIVPYTRGEEISRPYNDILSEITQLAKQGVHEIILLGQNVNAYKWISHNRDICTFAKLLCLVANIKEIKRIRFTTNNPIEFTDDIIKVYSDTTKLVNHLHLPIQSGSNNILKKMKRGYTVLEYKNIIQKLRKIRPEILISSDFIVGFPGETNYDFKKTMSIISDIDFDMSYSFIYSQRPGTPAAYFHDNIPENEKKQRLNLLQQLIKEQTIKHSKRMLNSIQNILVEKISNKNTKELIGRTENNRIVNFIGTQEMIGKFIDVKIIKSLSNSLYGKIIYK